MFAPTAADLLFTSFLLLIIAPFGQQDLMDLKLGWETAIVGWLCSVLRLLDPINLPSH